MITFNVFTIVIEKETSREPALYYNVINKKWVDEFQLGCGCVSRREAVEELNKLDVSGAYILEGQVS